MGGVRTNHTGESPTLKGLFAAGEAACWDMHGFNRLGGNSLSDLLVFGKRAGEFAAKFARENGAARINAADVDRAAKIALEPFERAGGAESPYQVQEDLQEMMQANVGIAMGAGTDIAIDAADIIVLNNRLEAVVTAREVSRWSYRKMVQNVCLAVLFNGIGVPLAATGLVYPIWAMAAMAVSVTLIFFNSLRTRPRIFFDAILSVGRVPAAA